MNLSTEQGNPFLSAYSLARRSGFLRTQLGRRIFRSAYFLYKRYVEDDLRDLLLAFPGLVSGGDVLDIGANIGYTAAVLARSVGAEQKVYAFEPEPFNFGILQQIAGQPDFGGKIIPLQYAVGAEEGTISLWINDRHHADHRVFTEKFRSSHPGSKEMTVPIVSIDDFLQKESKQIAFVKIDVQGYELAVCRGMEGTLQRNPGVGVMLEFTPAAMIDLGFQPRDLVRFFEGREFKVYQIHSRGRLTEGMPILANDWSYCNLLFSQSNIGKTANPYDKNHKR